MLGASRFLIVDKESEADRAKLSGKLTQMLLQRLEYVFLFSRLLSCARAFHLATCQDIYCFMKTLSS